MVRDHEHPRASRATTTNTAPAKTISKVSIRTPPKPFIWTRNQLTAEERQWLRDLKYTRMVANFTIVHATLDAPQRWGYVFDKLAAAASFPYQNTPVCFFGHTHVPVAFMRDTAVRGGTYSKFKIDPAKKYFINVGAVGQPRDNNPKAAYVVYDMDAGDDRTAPPRLRHPHHAGQNPRRRPARTTRRTAGVWKIISQ